MFDHIWEEIRRKHSAVGYHVLVHCEPPPDKIGRLLLPASLQGFYGRQPHEALVKAKILDCTELTELEIGQHIIFQRLFFRRIKELDDKSMLGTIHLADIWAVIPEDTNVSIMPKDPIMGYGR